MLDLFRDNARSWVLQVLIGAIAVVFIFSFGPGSKGCGGNDGPASWAARVNGEPVPVSAFENMLRRSVSMRQAMRRGSYTAEQAKADKVREEAMRAVVDQELVAQAAIAAGLWVGDDEVTAEIIKAPQFQKSGAFDAETYRRYVQNVEGLSLARFEERVRHDLLVTRMTQLAFGGIAVSDEELSAALARRDEEVSFDYVRLQPAMFRGEGAVTDAEIDAFLEKSGDKVQQKYNDSRFLFTEPEARKVRRLFAAAREDAPQAERDAAKARVEAAAAAIKAGGKWEDQAGQFTGDAAAQADGTLGWVAIGRSSLGKAVEEAAFAVKTGETSGVVQDRFGYSLLQVIEERAARERPFDEVKREIARDLAREDVSRARMQTAAQEATAKLKSGTSLKSLFPADDKSDKPATEPGMAEQQQRPVVKSAEGLKAYGGIIPDAGAAPSVTATVFALGADKRVPDAPIEDQGALWLVQVTGRRRADLAKLTEERDSLRQRLVGEKREELYRAWIESLRKEASISENSDLLSYDRKAGGYQPDEG